MPHQGETHPSHASLFWNGQYWDLKKTGGKRSDRCCTAYCRNGVYHECRRIGNTGRTRMVVHTRCTKCKTRRWRVNNPLKDAYKNLRSSASRRGIPFTLTLRHFEDVCDSSGYMLFKGCESNDLTVDRIDATLGYEDGNIQVMTRGDNAAKGNQERHLPSHIQEIIRRKKDLAAKKAAEVFSVWEDSIPVVDGALCPF